MAVTVSLYNHTAKRFAEGTNASGDTYKVKLLSSATFDASHATLAATGGTEATAGTGYTAGGATLTGVTVTTTGNDATWDASDVTWSASGGSITASAAIIYNDSDVDDPPVAFIDFGQSQSAGDGTDFKIVWHVNGIFTFSVA